MPPSRVSINKSFITNQVLTTVVLYYAGSTTQYCVPYYYELLQNAQPQGVLDSFAFVEYNRAVGRTVQYVMEAEHGVKLPTPVPEPGGTSTEHSPQSTQHRATKI